MQMTDEAARQERYETLKTMLEERRQEVSIILFMIHMICLQNSRIRDFNTEWPCPKPQAVLF